MPKVYITTSLESYRDFLSDDWATRIEALTTAAPKLSEIVLDLIVDWRAAAYTASLPAMALDQVKAYHDGYVNTSKINTAFLDLADVVIAKLATKLPELTVDPQLISRLRTAIVDLGVEWNDACRTTSVEFPTERVWNSCLNHIAYQLCLWGSQRICYVSIYNSYENFIVRALCVARSTDACRVTDHDFKDQFANSFGSNLLGKCWTRDAINVVRLVRHSLSHAGGCVTKHLAKQNHDFVLQDDRIQVTPDKTKALFSLLKDSVYALAEKAVAMPSFG